MFIELGHFSFILSFALSLLAMAIFCPFRHYLALQPGLLFKTLCFFQLWQFFLIGFSFISLVYAYLSSDFSVTTVYYSSYSEKPPFFKVSALWSTQEGSLLLWVFFLQILYLFFLYFQRQKICAGKRFFIQFSMISFFWQNFILASLCGFLFFLANPFLRSPSNELQGLGLNPLLQDLSLAVHPPLLYMGYAFLALCFCLTMGALGVGRFYKVTLKLLRYWALLGWIFLTLAIIIGSYWAYYELGWGGYWGWDPVENISLLIWLSHLLFIHMIKNYIQKGSYLKVSLFLGLFSFFLVLIGLCFVRSGLLSSVHSFAIDPWRGLGLALVSFALVAPAFGYFVYRSLTQKTLLQKNFSLVPLSFSAAMLSLALCAFVIAVGSFSPVFYQAALGRSLAVGIEFFKYYAGFFISLAALCLTILLLQSLAKSGLFALLSLLLFGFFFWQSESVFYSLFFALGITLALASFITKFYSFFSAGGMAHFSLALFFVFIAVNGAYSYQQIYQLKLGQAVQFKECSLVFERINTKKQANYKEQIFSLGVYEPSKQSQQQNYLTELQPSFRYFMPQNLRTTEVSLFSFRGGQLYVAPLDEAQENVSFLIYWQAGLWILYLALVFIIASGIVACHTKMKKIIYF